MSRRTLLSLIIACSALLTASGLLEAQTPSARDVVDAVLKQEGPDYLRFHAGEKRSSLETRITRFKTEDGQLEIALFAAVHIADADYYRSLQKDLKGYDVVLFEGVKMKEGDEPDEVLTAIGRLQRDLGAALGLTHQSAVMSTEGRQFHRADLDSAEVKAELARRKIELVPGADLLKSFGPLLRRGLRMLAPKEGEELSGFKAALRDKVKLGVARALADGEGLYAKMKGDDGKKRDEVIIGARNARAMTELDRVLASQKKPARIAILYGAAHMADFETRLRKRFPGLRDLDARWMQAWTIGEPPAKGETAKPKKKDAPAPKVKGSRKRDL